MTICYESNYCEEWYQHEFNCSECGVVFMYSDYQYDKSKPRPKPEPQYCPNCGCKFEMYVYN